MPHPNADVYGCFKVEIVIFIVFLYCTIYFQTKPENFEELFLKSYVVVSFALIMATKLMVTMHGTKRLLITKIKV